MRPKLKVSVSVSISWDQKWESRSRSRSNETKNKSLGLGLDSTIPKKKVSVSVSTSKFWSRPSLVWIRQSVCFRAREDYLTLNSRELGCCFLPRWWSEGLMEGLGFRFRQKGVQTMPSMSCCALLGMYFNYCLHKRVWNLTTQSL